jgi:hypothetical protein
MEPTAGSREPHIRQKSFAFGQGDGKTDQPGEVQRELSADSKSLSASPAEVAEPASPAPEKALPSIWLQRLRLITHVTFCLYLGLLLIVLPWKESVWTANHLLAGYPAMRAVYNSYFFRGVVTGLGLLDVWIGISAAVQYRENKPLRP